MRDCGYGLSKLEGSVVSKDEMGEVQYTFRQVKSFWFLNNYYNYIYSALPKLKIYFVITPLPSVSCESSYIIRSSY